MDRLKGKCALVTGAGRIGNIGVAICEAFLKEGAAGVLATDIRPEQQQAVEDALAQFGADRFKFVQHDATSEEDWRRVAEEMIATFGQIDILVNNVGIALEGGVFDTTLESLRRSMAINHDSIFLGTKVCAPLMESAITRHPGGGSIINTVSMASYMPSAHHTSKAAARMLTLCTAAELGPKRIRVNSIHPGMTMTPMLREGFEHYVERGVWPSIEVAEQSLAAMAPLQIGSVPEDTAHAFVYLASDESRFVTGSAIYHDGGLGQQY
jgi:3alpha(or 20beta)-hydroxysteroid dehydrogenase/cyclopentanol dehydrogenase